MAAANNDPNKTNNDQFSNNSNYINPYYNSIRNAEQNTDIDYIRQFLIYYSLGKMFLRPAGIFSGQIINEYLTTIPYILRRSNGEIRWIPYDPDNAMMQNDYHYVMETNVAPSDTANVTVVARNKAKVYVYGEIYRGFSFEADSTLELHGILYIGHWTQDGLTEEYVNRNSIIEAHEGNVVIFLCDYKEIVVLRDGNSKYMIKLTNDDKEKSKSKSHAQAKGGVIQFDPPKPINNQGQQQAGQQQAQPGQQAQPQQQQQAQQPSPIEMIVEKSVSRSKRVKSETQAPPPPPPPQVEAAQPPVQQEEPPSPPPPIAPPPTPPEPQSQPQQQQQILTSTFYQDPFAQQDSQIPPTSVPSSQITESQSTTPSQPISQSESTAAAPPTPTAAPPTPAAPPPPTPAPAPPPPPPTHKSTTSKFPPQYTSRGGFDDFGWNASQLFQSAHKSQTGSGGASTTATGPTKSGSTTITIKVAKSIEVVSDDKTIEALRQLSSKALQQRSQQSTQTPGSNASSGSGVTVNKSKVATMKTKHSKGKRSLAQKSSKMTGKKPKGSKPANMKMSQSKFVGSKRTVDGGGGGAQPTPSSESPKNHVVKAKKSQVGKQKIRKSKSTFMPKKPGSKSKFGIKQPPPQGHRKLSFASSGGGFKGGKSRSAIQQRPKSQLQDTVPKSNATYVDSMQIEVTDDQQVVTIAPTPAPSTVPPPTFDQPSSEQPLTDYSGQQQQGMQDPGTSGIPAIAVYQQTVQTYDAPAPAADQPPPSEQTQLKDNMVVINGPGGGGSPPPPTGNQGQDQTLLIKTEGGLTYEIPLAANTGTTITAITTTEVPLGPKEPPPQPKGGGKQSKFGKIVKAKTPKTPKKSMGPKSPKPKTKSTATSKASAAKSPKPVAKRKISQQLKKRPSVTTVKVSKSKFSLGTNKGKSPAPTQYDHQQQQMAAHKSKTSATKSMFKVTTTGTVKIKRKATLAKEKTHLNKLKAKMEISQLMRDMSASHSRLTMSKLERTRSATAAPDPDDQANFDKNLNEEVEQLKEKMAQVVVILRQLVDTISEGPEQDELNRDLKELESYADKLSPEQFERLSGKIVSIANRIDEITGM